MTSSQEYRLIVLAYLFAIGATVIWSVNYIIARGLVDSVPPVSLAFLRWLVAVIVFLPFALKPLIAERATLRANITYLSISALLGVTLFNTLIYLAAHTTSVINLSLISITFPVFIIIFSRIYYGELITVNKSIGIVLVVIGVVVLVTKGDLSRLLDLSLAIGDLWMLVAAVGFAVYSMLLKHKPEHLSIWALQLSTFILGLVFLLPFFVLEYITAPHFELSTTSVFSILYLGIFASLLAFILWNKAIVTLGPSKAGMIYYTLPLFSGLSAYLFLKEDIGLLHFYSALLIVSGVVAANYESKKSKK